MKKPTVAHARVDPQQHGRAVITSRSNTVTRLSNTPPSHRVGQSDPGPLKLFIHRHWQTNSASLSARAPEPLTLTPLSFPSQFLYVPPDPTSFFPVSTGHTHTHTHTDGVVSTARGAAAACTSQCTCISFAPSGMSALFLFSNK
jgi:hypothetical protein